MRGEWLLGALAAAAALAACVLPAATISAGTGGGTGTGTGGSSTTTSGGGPSPPMPARQSAIVIDNGDAVHAPSGNPGQRHIIWASGSWWAFFIGSQKLRSMRASDAPPSATATWTESTSFTFDFGPPGSADGRSFGVDTRDVGQVSVHFSLSSGNLQRPLSHALGIISGVGLTTQSPLAVLTQTDVPAFAGDGTVTSIGFDAPHLVTDFASVPSQLCESCAIVSPNPDDGGAWFFGAGTLTDLGVTAPAIRMRATMAMEKGLFALWRANTAIQIAHRSADGTWGPASILSGSGPLDSTRTFASCTQPPSRGRVLAWSGSAFSFTTIASDENRMVEALPPKLGDDLRELVLACGPKRVHAFAIDGKDPKTIMGASWDPNHAWSAWAPVVDAKDAVKNRCFLTGFDRTAGPDGNKVGLAWTEADVCAFPEQQRLFSAFVEVNDG